MLLRRPRRSSARKAHIFATSHPAEEMRDFSHSRPTAPSAASPTPSQIPQTPPPVCVSGLPAPTTGDMPPPCCHAPQRPRMHFFIPISHAVEVTCDEAGIPTVHRPLGVRVQPTPSVAKGLVARDALTPLRRERSAGFPARLSPGLGLHRRWRSVSPLSESNSFDSIDAHRPASASPCFCIFERQSPLGAGGWQLDGRAAHLFTRHRGGETLVGIKRARTDDALRRQRSAPAPKRSVSALARIY